MTKLFNVVLATLLVASTICMHLQDTVQAQVDALKAQQDNFQKSVNKLILNITQVQKSVNSSTNMDQKILILENAIISERESVFELSKIIIPPFNISKDGCEKMTDQQKVQLLEQLSQARKQVLELKNISYSMPKCDDVDQIKRDIEKQIFFLNSIQSIIYTNCSMNVILSPTIWQTNIYSPNWVLGNMTIDDLIEQYYQRSIRYDNITNCDIQKPYFNGKQCILCSGTTPVFDISQKKCISCPNGTIINNDQKKCVPIQYYTNFTGLNNFSPVDGPFPTPDPNAVPCAKQAPYYNGTGCIVCQLPSYFDIPSQTCKTCASGFIFDLNQRQCIQIQKNMLTKLQNTRWVTGPNNFTNVLQERLSILQSNPGKYTECPQQNPYYNGYICMNCNGQQFDLRTLKCVTAANGTQFDPNIHNYIPPMTKGQTLPTAPNLIGKPGPDDPNTPNCNQTHPYWDGISCIICPQPFIYFDLNSKTCVICDAKDYYDAQTKSCLPRKTIYISTNQNNLLATPTRSIADYKNNITNTIQNNPNAIIVNCDSNTQYSDYNSCFSCASNQYFNVETLKCAVCNDIYDPATKTCKKPVLPTLTFTNLNAPNIINLADPTKEQQNINSQLAANPNNKVCPIDTPYYDGSKCINCIAPNIFFDYVKKTCSGCKSNQYLDDNGKCQDAPIVSNIKSIVAANKYIQTKPDGTISNLNQTVQNYVAAGTPYIQCSTDKPYFNQTTNVCSACPTNQYLDILNKQCVVCATYNATTHTCPPPVVIPPAPKYPNMNTTSWVANNISRVIQWRNNLKAVNGSTICPDNTPFYNGTACIFCPATSPLFNYDTLSCMSCPSPTVFDINVHRCLNQLPEGTYQTNLGSPNLIYGGVPLAQWQQYYTNNQTAYPNIKDCPAANYYWDGINCVECQPGMYFNLQSRLCMHCPTDTVYDSSNAYWKGCINTTTKQRADINPDIAKMYANIF